MHRFVYFTLAAPMLMGAMQLLQPALIIEDSAAISNNQNTQLAAPDTLEEVFQYAEVQAEFPGGEVALQNYLRDSLVYPQSAIEAGKKGVVFLYFVIRKDGSLSDIQLLKGIPDAPELDAEAIRLIKAMPKWKPGKIKGKPVNLAMRLPVRFVLK